MSQASFRMSRWVRPLEQDHEPAIQQLLYEMTLSVELMIRSAVAADQPRRERAATDAPTAALCRGTIHSSRLMHIVQNSQRLRDNDVHQNKDLKRIAGTRSTTC
ncbi:hypothetical protein MPLB_2160002 [Mesorhizobium sp. ORS 3324]|nr:hypothetical protein MPLB_2160002 [Mesorhizobium sp. ORS 3324]